MHVANELAIGGVTDTKTAVDALTNVVNAYAGAGAQARDVSDAFFITIRAGKTTAAELAATIGRVAPTAASLGVSFSDLLAAIAAISGQGLDTAEAVTGLKAALANVIKPTSDATKEAARLGIRFDAATLRARGLNGFLRAVTSSARFNADSLAKLFGSIEGLNAVTALTANQSATFTTILGQMATRSGATKAAFDRMAGTLAFQERRFQALKENALIVIGQALEPLAKSVVSLANTVLESFLQIPKPIRDFVVKVFAAVSALLVVLGGFIAAKAAVALFLVGLKALGITIGGLLAPLLPLLAAFAVLTLAVAGFAVAFRHDVGGIASFFEDAAARVKLLVQGLAQLFREGGFSGAVMDELARVRSRSRATWAIDFFSSSTSRTAPALNSSVKCRRARLFRFDCAVILAIVPTSWKVSTKAGQAQLLGWQHRERPTCRSTSKAISSPTSRSSRPEAVTTTFGIGSLRISRRCLEYAPGPSDHRPLGAPPGDLASCTTSEV